MKPKTLTEIALASVICAPSCAVEHGVVIERQDLSSERALYVNLIRKNKSKQKPLHVNADGTFDADRKLFFDDSTYVEPFIYSLPGDTIAFHNPCRKTYLNINRRHHIRDINGVRDADVVYFIKSIMEKQK